MTRRPAPWATYLVAGTAAAALVLLLPDSAVRDLCFVLVAATAPVAIGVGTRRHRPIAEGAWYAMAAALTLWVVGCALLALEQRTVWTSPVAPDLIRLMLYPMVTAGLWLLSRSRTAGLRIEAILDVAIVSTSALMISVVFLVGPSWAAGTGADRWWDAAFPLGSVLVFAFLVRLAYAPGAGRLSSIVVVVGLGLTLGYQAVAHVVPELPTLASGAGALTVEWLPAMVVTGAAALHPSMRLLSQPTPPRPEPPHSRQIAVAGMALATGPAIIAVQFVAGVPFSAGVIAVFYVPLLAMVYLRMLTLVRQVNDQATTDPLTGLPNRRALHNAGRLRLADRSQQQSLLLLDLDRFKEVNDSLGHHAGDELLIAVAGRLRSTLRADDLIVRLGGDEFAVLLEGAGADESEAVAVSLGRALSEPFDLGGFEVRSSASIGIALFPEHGTDLSTLLRKADRAMYCAKISGAPCLHRDAQDSAESLHLAEELRAALLADALVLHYQPVLELRTGRVVGVEALVRWQHPERGLLHPADFLGPAEAAGLMAPLTRAVLARAVGQAARWRSAGQELSVAVNLSAGSLLDRELPTLVVELLAAHDLPPAFLTVEVAEEVLRPELAHVR
uniref:putative bifunctional diguanylate cyclase/phosphodiesterase n=1 Tax=Actinotalea sp. TaxID=1872145 RepID=UPI003563007E